MPDRVRDYLRLAFPAGLLLLLMTAAGVFYGADIPAAKLIFSCVAVCVAGLAAVLNAAFRPTPGTWAGLAILMAFAAQHAAFGWMDTAAPEFAALGAAGCIWLVARNSALESDTGILLWRASLVTGTILGIWAFIDFTTGLGAASPMRLSGGFLSANTAATFFGMISLMGLVEFLGQLRRNISSLHSMSRNAPGLALSLVAVLVPATCLVLTASRGGIAFAALCGLALTGWQVLAWTRAGDVGRRSAGLGAFAIAAVVIVAGLVWTLSGELAATRYIAALGENSRIDMFVAYGDAVALAPVAGHGLGSFVFTNDLITTSQTIRSLGTTNAAHNVFLQWLLQAGWTGALAMWGVVGALVWMVVRGLRVRRRHRGYLRAVLCISAFVVLHGLTDFGLEIPGVMWWWAWLLGIGAGLAAGGSRRNKPAAGGQGMPAMASRLSFALVAFALAGWMGWQGQMRVQANLAEGLPADTIVQIAARDILPASAYLMDAYAARASAADVSDLGFAERASLAAIEREPRLVSAWNRLVYVDIARHGRLTDAGQNAFARSLYLSPYGSPEVIRWRVQVAASAWGELNALNRRQIRSQLQALAVRDSRWLREFAAVAPAEFRGEIEAVLNR